MKNNYKVVAYGLNNSILNNWDLNSDELTDQVKSSVKAMSFNGDLRLLTLYNNDIKVKDYDILDIILMQ